jgi:hypothetical protein
LAFSGSDHGAYNQIESEEQQTDEESSLEDCGRKRKRSACPIPIPTQAGAAVVNVGLAIAGVSAPAIPWFIASVMTVASKPIEIRRQA